MQILKGLLGRRIRRSSIADRFKRPTAGEWTIHRYHSHDLIEDSVFVTVLSLVIGRVILILTLDGAIGQVTTQDQVTIPGPVTFADQVTTLDQVTFAGRVTTQGLATAHDGVRRMMITFRGSHRALFCFRQCPMVVLHLRMVDIECQDIQDIAWLQASKWLAYFSPYGLKVT